MSVQRLSCAPAGGACGTIVLLPAAAQRLEDFHEAGFPAALQRRAPSWHLEFVAPPMAHLTDRTWIQALRQEVIECQPAPVRPLWLGGISLGAFMALRYAASHGQGVDGLCLIAPYLGSRIVAAEIARSDSIEKWQPGTPAHDDDERLVWSYVRSWSRSRPELFLGLSHQDRFADTQRLLAHAVRAEDRVEIPGTHAWPAWRELWERFIERLT